MQAVHVSGVKSCYLHTKRRKDMRKYVKLKSIITRPDEMDQETEQRNKDIPLYSNVCAGKAISIFHEKNDTMYSTNTTPGIRCGFNFH